MIQELTRIRGCRVFRDFTWPTDLSQFGEKNLVYGWNGTGKSTISAILRAMERHEPFLEGDVSVLVDGRVVRGADFASDRALPPVRVFDRRFVEENVFTINDLVSPILFLGRQSVEAEKLAEEIRTELERKTADLADAEKDKEKLGTALDRFCADKAKYGVKIVLRSSGEGNKYSDYNKGDFEKACRRLVAMPADGRQQCVLSEARDEELRKLVSATPKKRLAEPEMAMPNAMSLDEDVQAVLEESVVSNVLSALESDARLSAWVQEGLDLHRTAEASICLFCDQAMPPGRLRTLQEHFGEGFVALAGRIDELTASLEQQRDSLKAASFPHVSELQDHLSARYEQALTGFELERANGVGFLNELIADLGRKRLAMFEPVTRLQTLPTLSSESHDCLIALIAEHNEASDDFSAKVATARGELEESVVAGCVDEYEAMRSEAEAATRLCASLRSEIKELTAQAQVIEREAISHLEPADELNSELTAYLGRSELRFEVDGAGYRLTRDSQFAKDLSEGEKTGIALLYFLKSLQDKDFQLSKGLVVIDDPVSSLDSNSLYCAFGYLKERTEAAGQLLILTHNHTFLRLIKNWFVHVNRRAKGTARMYLLSCMSEGGIRRSAIGPMDPLLAKYESEYHFLFRVVWDAAGRERSSCLEDYHWLPNVARRLLESFMAFKQPGEGSLHSKLEATSFDAVKRSRMLRFLNTYSHNEQIGEADDDLLVLAETPAVLRDLLSFIKDMDGGHYERMVELVNGSEGGATAAPAVGAT